MNPKLVRLIFGNVDDSVADDKVPLIYTVTLATFQHTFSYLDSQKLQF